MSFMDSLSGTINYTPDNSTQLFAGNQSLHNNNNISLSNSLINNNFTDYLYVFNNYYNYYNSKNLSKNLWIYLSPCIFFTGLVGNCLILLVMTKTHLHSKSTCTYLKSMAVADLFTLVTGMVPEWLDYMDLIILKETHYVSCKLEKFINFTSTDTSIWICVAFTIDRLIAVCFPMAKCKFCLRINAKYYVLSAFLTAILKNLHVFWTRGAEYVKVASQISLFSSPHNPFTTNNVPLLLKLVSNCGSPTAEFKYFETYVRPWVAFFSISLLPCLIIVSSNVLIIRSLLLMRFNKNKIPSNHEAASVRQMTTLCLTASICFLVCNTPSILMLIMKPYWKHTQAYHLAKPFINQIFFINHSVNFFLYCITGKRFREALIRIFSPSSNKYILPSKLHFNPQSNRIVKKTLFTTFNFPFFWSYFNNSPEVVAVKH